MRKLTPKFEKPHKPWDRARIESERRIASSYGLRRKQEIWKAESILRTFRRIARELGAKKDKAREEMFLGRVKKFGLISPAGTLDDVLNLQINDILERRLQTLVQKKGFASTPRQARQFIVHGHMALGGRKARWPSTIVDVEGEKTICFRDGSRMKTEKIAKAEKIVEKEKEEKTESKIEKAEKNEKAESGKTEKVKTGKPEKAKTEKERAELVETKMEKAG